MAHARFQPDALDRAVAAGSVIILLAATTAVARGSVQWAQVPWAVWWHLATVVPALALTPVMLLRRKGDSAHRWLGYVWVAALFTTAVISFNIRELGAGHLSVIHVLSALTAFQAPRIVLLARNGNVVAHRKAVRALALGGLLIAGFFTFPFDRLLGHWLFG